MGTFPTTIGTVIASPSALQVAGTRDYWVWGQHYKGVHGIPVENALFGGTSLGLLSREHKPLLLKKTQFVSPLLSHPAAAARGEFFVPE